MTTDLDFQEKTYLVAVQLRLLDFYNPEKKAMRDNKAHQIYKSFSNQEIDNLIQDLDFEIFIHGTGNDTPETRKDLHTLAELAKGLSFSSF